MIPVTTIQQLNSLVSTTYVYSVATALVAVALVFLFTSLIPWEGGADKSYVKRRWVLVIMGLLAFFGFYLYGDLVILPRIKNSGFQAMYSNKLLLASLLELVVYVASSFVLMLVLRNGKFGSMLGKQNK